MLDLMPKISERADQFGGTEEYISKYGKAEIQFFPREYKPHKIDFAPMVEELCSKYKMKEITIHPPLLNYDIEVVMMYDENIIVEQLKQLVELSKKFNIKMNLVYHTHWCFLLHKANTIDRIKKLLEILDGSNVTILLENLLMIIEPKTECTVLALCKEIDNPHLRMCLDICHFHAQANIFKEDIETWLEYKLNKEDCEKYIYQVHFSYTANNDGYIDKRTHGIGHPTKELLLEDFKLLEKYGISSKQIVTEIAEKDYSYRKDQLQDLRWLEEI